MARFPPPPPETTQVNVGAPSTTALVPAGLAFLSDDPPSIATASERRRPSEAIAGGPERMGPIRAASGSFSAAACGVGVRVKAKVVALEGPEAVYSIVPARLSMEVQGLALAAVARESRAVRESRARKRSLCFFLKGKGGKERERPRGRKGKLFHSKFKARQGRKQHVFLGFFLRELGRFWERPLEAHRGAEGKD